MNASAPALFRLAPNTSERQKCAWEEHMRLWLHDQISEQLYKSFSQKIHYDNKTNEFIVSEEWAIWLARTGDPSELRKLYPQLADLIFSPKQPQRYQRPKFDAAKASVDFARRIRALWGKQYGKVKRTRDESQAGISAEHFAVDICKMLFPEKSVHLTIEAVLAAAKPSGKHKPGRKRILRAR
ncbi:hypothetical protein AB8Z38_20910 [Bradyrhizobium sp. LLZ17]|uniref:Uncharacterized protein n=1 Tax=Bradyrhizobium sp. LLZ17 TaxID=3239388 RepID=A0AB39XDG9_9BRAD